MDATCNVQDSIHMFHLVHNMCPGLWVHIRWRGSFILVVSNALIDFLDLFFIKMMGDQPDDHVNEGEFDNE